MAYVVPLTSRLPFVMDRVYPLANLPVTVKVTVPDAGPVADLFPTTWKSPEVLVMVMVCPTVRPGMLAAVTGEVVPATLACGVAAKTGVSAPDIARSAAR